LAVRGARTRCVHSTFSKAIAEIALKTQFVFRISATRQEGVTTKARKLWSVRRPTEGQRNEASTAGEIQIAICCARDFTLNFQFAEGNTRLALRSAGKREIENGGAWVSEAGTLLIIAGNRA